LNAAGGQESPSEVDRRGQAGEGEVETRCVGYPQGMAFEEVGRVGPYPGHEGQGLAIGSEQNVLAVVQGLPARPPAGLEERDAGPCSHQVDGGGESRPAGADDGDLHANIQVFQAIQSLRTGVRAMRWWSTR
jgi:hypothetical protein